MLFIFWHIGEKLHDLAVQNISYIGEGVVHIFLTFKAVFLSNPQIKKFLNAL